MNSILGNLRREREERGDVKTTDLFDGEIVLANNASLVSQDCIELCYVVNNSRHMLKDSLLMDFEAFHDSLARADRILDLACGSGVCGLLVRKKFPNVGFVCLSDRPDNLARAAANTKLNCGGDSAERVAVVGHRWGEDVGPLLAAGAASVQYSGAQARTYDVVLLSSVVYTEETWLALLRTLQGVTHSGSVVYLYQTADFTHKWVELALLPRSRASVKTPFELFIAEAGRHFEVTSLMRDRLWRLERTGGGWLINNNPFI